MAKLIRKPSALKEDYLKSKKRLRVASLCSFALVLFAIIGSICMQNDTLFTFGLIITLLSAVGFMLCMITIILRQSDLTIKKQGVDGEDLTADILKDGLSDRYTIFQNSVITLDGKSSELDLIVVGESGVFIVEAKNRNGRITGGYSKDKWTQHKVGQKGGEYSADFYSPVRQVSTHIFRLAGFLRQNGVRVHINGIVYFSNSYVELELTGTPDKIPVFAREKDLLRFIKKNENMLSYETIEQICNLLK